MKKKTKRPLARMRRNGGAGSTTHPEYTAKSPNRKGRRPSPVTTGDFLKPLPIPVTFPRVTQRLAFDRIRYWMEPNAYHRLRPHLGPLRKRVVTRHRMVHRFADVLPGKMLTVTFSRRRPMEKVLLDVDDPMDAEQAALLELFRERAGKGWGVSEIEIALDLRSGHPGLLLRLVNRHLHLPYARRAPRIATGKRGRGPVTAYSGSMRGGPRGVKVYEKELEQTVVRIEWTLHGDLGLWGLSPREVLRLQQVKMNKLLHWREFDAQRAAELMFQRWSRRPLSFHARRDPWLGVTLAHWRNRILEEVNPGGVDHVEVLGRLWAAYKKLPFARPQDKAAVFPQLP